MSYGTPPPGGPSDSGSTPSGDQPGQNPAGAPPPPPPSYGQQAPQYGQQPPAYGQQPPQYGQQPPQYGQQPPAYGQPPTAGGYGAAPPPMYGASPSSVGALVQWPQRAGGYLIDLLLTLPGIILTSIDSRDGSLGALYFVGLVYILGIDIWNRWLKGGSTGQTIGRGVMGIKLVSEATGQPIGAGKAFLRDLAHIVDSVICYVGWLFPLWDSKRQTLADKIVGTVVVEAPKGA